MNDQPTPEPQAEHLQVLLATWERMKPVLLGFAADLPPPLCASDAARMYLGAAAVVLGAEYSRGVAAVMLRQLADQLDSGRPPLNG